MSKDSEVIIFDTDQHYMTVIDLILSTWDLNLLGSAYDLETSKALVEKIEKKEIKPKIAIIDAYMGKSEEDGSKIAAKLRELVPGIKIIGFSTVETAEWADIEAIKSLRDNNKTIISALTDLLGLEYSLSNVTDENKPKDSD